MSSIYTPVLTFYSRLEYVIMRNMKEQVFKMLKRKVSLVKFIVRLKPKDKEALQ